MINPADLWAYNLMHVVSPLQLEMIKVQVLYLATDTETDIGVNCGQKKSFSYFISSVRNEMLEY